MRPNVLELFLSPIFIDFAIPIDSREVEVVRGEERGEERGKV